MFRRCQRTLKPSETVKRRDPVSWLDGCLTTWYNLAILVFYTSGGSGPCPGFGLLLDGSHGKGDRKKREKLQQDLASVQFLSASVPGRSPQAVRCPGGSVNRPGDAGPGMQGVGGGWLQAHVQCYVHERQTLPLWGSNKDRAQCSGRKRSYRARPQLFLAWVLFRTSFSLDPSTSCMAYACWTLLKALRALVGLSSQMVSARQRGSLP